MLFRSVLTVAEHRFFEKWDWTSNPALVEMAKKFQVDSFIGVVEKFKGYIGNKLHDFK